MSSRKNHLLLVAILIVAFFLRFVELTWGEGYYFHPDENNMAQAVLSLDQTGQPNFYAYGQLSLFSALFSARIYNLFSFIHQQHQLDFGEAVFFLRFWSAMAGLISIFFVYLLGKKLINVSGGLMAAAITAFFPGLIQASHFGTTESLLTCFYLAITHYSLKIYQEKKITSFIASGLFLGLALATKISAAIFVFLPLTAVIINLKKEKGSIKNQITGLVTLVLLALIVTIAFSPFLIINFPQNLQTIRHEVAIAQGKIIPFYTRQFLTSTPFWFQIKKIFPFLLGWPVLVFSVLGAIAVIANKQKGALWSIILLPTLIFFLYQGQLFVKWSRFMVPIAPIFSLLAANWLIKLSRPLQYIILIGCFLPGVFFFDLVYTQPDIRQQFSSWAKENFSQNSIILSESGNVVNLPLGTNHQITNFDFYQLEKGNNLSLLCQALEVVDYVIVPSRRVFANHSSDLFPIAANYYQKLFSGQLGFSLLETFSPTGRYRLTNFYYQTSEVSAEETWTVFDHPTIRLYQKTRPYLAGDYQNILSW